MASPQAKMILLWLLSAMTMVLTASKTLAPYNTSDHILIISMLSIGIANWKSGTLITTQMVLFVSEVLTIPTSD